MPPRPIIEQLPTEIREWLDAELLRCGFAGYVELTTALNEKLAERGLEMTVGKTAVNAYGQIVEERIQALKRSTEVARTLAREVGDDEGALNDAVVRIYQDKLFQATLDLEINPEKLNLYKLGHVISDLVRASVTQKKHMAEARAKMDEKLKGLEAEAKSGKSKLDPETLRRVREEVYGQF